MLKHRPLVLSEDCVCEACGDAFSVAESCKRHIRDGRCANIEADAIAVILARRKAAADARKHKNSRAGRRKRRGKADGDQVKTEGPEAHPDAGISFSAALLPTPEPATTIPMSNELFTLISALFPQDGSNSPILEAMSATTAESSAQDDHMDDVVEQYVDFDCFASNPPLGPRGNKMHFEPAIVVDAAMELTNEPRVVPEAVAQPYQPSLVKFASGDMCGDFELYDPDPETYLQAFYHDVDVEGGL